MFNIIGEIIKVPIKTVMTGGVIFKDSMDALCGDDVDILGDIDDIWSNKESKKSKK